VSAIAKSLCGSVTGRALGAALDACRSIRDLFDISISTRKDREFGLPGGRAREVRAKLGSIEFSLHRGQVISQQLTRERSNASWATAGIGEDGAHLRLWSEIQAKGRLAGIEVWSQAFSDLAMLTEDSPESKLKPDFPDSIEQEPLPPKDIDLSSEIEPAEDRKPVASEISSSPADSHDRHLINLHNHQAASWTSRSKTVDSHLRVALCQLRVENHSYQHPLYDVSNTDLGSEGVNYHKEPWLWNKADSDQIEGKAASAVEGHRRRVLAEVIKACDKFGVDVLLLPEYSVRPETVIWLRHRMSDLRSDLAIWAGTFRKPPGMQIEGESWINVLDDWCSALPVVLRRERNEQYEICVDRTKRYGAIAVNEWFNPSGDASLKAVSDALGLDPATDMRAWLIELICSEVFMASSPSNLHSLAEYYGKMLDQIGIKSDKTSIERIMDDIKWFAENTTLTRYRGIGLHRKSIVLIPAYTARATDYAVFGQASYLSSGLVSVFCDAVSSKGGRGCSCFIGDNSWDDEDDHSMHEQRLCPYHGVFPGMYRQWAQERGWLGTQEQALVIADIDPIHTVPGKPRQQTLLNPMELVAHLPIIECNGDSERAESIVMIGRDIEKLPRSARHNTAALTKNDAASVSSILKKLASLDGVLRDHAATGHKSKKQDSWLSKRHQAFVQHHHGLPHSWPFPCLIDWLLIPDEINPKIHLLDGETTLPLIRIPPYSTLGSDSLSEDDS